MGIHDAQLNCQDGGHNFIAFFLLLHMRAVQQTLCSYGSVYDFCMTVQNISNHLIPSATCRLQIRGGKGYFSSEFLVFSIEN